MLHNYKFVSMLFVLFYLFAINAHDSNAGDKNTSFKEGYIIKTNNDTIYGYIKTQSGSNLYYSCFFKASGDASWRKYTPQDITGYSPDGKSVYNSVYLYLNDFLHKDVIKENVKSRDSVQFKEYILSRFHKEKLLSDIPFDLKIIKDSAKTTILQPVFLKLLFKGKLSLLQFKNKMFLQNEDSFAHVLQNTVIEVEIEDSLRLFEKKEYLKLLFTYTDECIELHQSFAIRTNLTKRSLMNSLTRYSDCAGYDYEVIDKPFYVKNRIGYYIGFLASKPYINIDKDKYEYYENVGSPTNYSLHQGVFYERLFLKNNYAITFLLGLSYAWYEYPRLAVIEDMTDDMPEYTRIYYNEVDAKFHNFQMPFSVGYKQMNIPLKPEIYAGLSLNYGIMSEFFVRHEKINLYNDTHEITEIIIPNSFFHPYSIGFFAGINLEHDIYENYSLFSSIQYAYDPNMVKDNFSTGSYGFYDIAGDISDHSLMLKLGVKYNFD